VITATDPYDRILGFLDRSRYFFFQVASSSSIVLTRLTNRTHNKTGVNVVPGNVNDDDDDDNDDNDNNAKLPLCLRKHLLMKA
jgi:hypothetical protein